MGTLISCHKTSKISAKTVSIQAADCVQSLQTTELLADDQDAPKTVVTELNIGDGDLTNLECIEHEHPIYTRTNKENKPRRGVHRQKSPPEKSTEGGLERALQYDHLLLPGQVSPREGSPLLLPRAGRVDRSEGTIWSYFDNPTKNKNSVDIKHEVPTSQESCLQSSGPQTKKMGISPEERFTVTSRGNNQDENSNIVEDRTAVTPQLSVGLHNRNIAAGTEVTPKKDQELTVGTRTFHRPSVVGYDSRYSSGSSRPTSPRKATTVVCSRRKEPPYVRSPRKLLYDRNSEFLYSLEDALQCNVPCSDEILEATAVTGTPSCRLPQPPCGVYPINLELKVMMRGAGVDKDAVVPEQDALVDPDSNAGLQPQLQGAEGGGAGHKGVRQDGDGDRQPRRERSQHKQEVDNSDIKGSTETATEQRLSSEEVQHKEPPEWCSEADTGKQLSAVQLSVVHPENGPSVEAAGRLQSLPSRSTLSDSLDASDLGSTKSTISTDIEHSQNVLKEATQSETQSSFKAHGSAEAGCQTTFSDHDHRQTARQVDTPGESRGPAHQRNHEDQEQTQEATEARANSQGIVLNAVGRAEVKEPRMSYQAIQEAVSRAILKLSNMQMDEEFGKDLGESVTSMNKTSMSDSIVELDRTENASPETSCHPEQLDEEPDQSIVLQSMEIGGENRSQDTQAVSLASFAYPPGKGTPEGKGPCSTGPSEGTDGGSDLADSQDHTSSTPNGADTTRTKEDGRPLKAAVAPKEAEGAGVESQDWEVIPLHRVFGHTNLCGSATSASVSPPKMHGLTSRSVPPSAGVLFIVGEPNQTQHETKFSALPEDQMINMALSGSRRLTAESQELQSTGGIVQGSSYDDHGQLPPSTEKACSENICTKPKRLPNRGIPGKSPRERAITTHEHFQLAEDVFQTWATKNSALAHRTSSSLQSSSVSPLAGETHSLPTGTHTFSPEDLDKERNARSARSVPMDSDKDRLEQKPSQ